MEPLLLVMLVGVAVHAASTKDTLGWKWFIYMTNQVIETNETAE
jgi:hypothetical protein